MAKELVKQLWEQAQIGKPDTSLNKKIARITPMKDGDAVTHHEILCECGTRYLSKTVMLALGMGAFQPRKLEVPGLAEREGRNVHYVVKPLDHYNGKDVLVIGGGDSAADWTLALAHAGERASPRARSTALIHRGTKFTAHEASVDQIRKETKADVRLTHELQKLEDEGGRLRCTLVNNVTKETSPLTVDEIIVCAGYLAKLDFVKESGLAMAGNSIQVNERMETNIPGIYAVGDVATHGGKLKLIATGVGEAAIAANFAKTRIDPSAKAFPGHSTSKFEKKE
ncbi:MAG: NAD(P)/FAD-dependent oxidoreductase [Bdellovibrionales bacterium]|nr:NAD(P)/FAD-dependent oxidoreductase [Bdellovibrionales bacterium]